MPFSVFRKHQRKLLAVFAILAMFSFVLSDSLPSWVGGRGASRAGDDPVVAKLNWTTLRASDLEPMRVQRQRANFFVSQVFRGDPRYAQFFGGISTPELVDALILEHEADRLGMPASSEVANKWLRQRTGGAANAQYFQDIYRRSALAQQVTDEQLLAEIANQIRIGDVRRLPLTAEVTPLDVYWAYREQTQKVSAFAVPVRVEEFLARVPEPTDAEVRTLFETARTVLPDPTRPTPGFLVPQKVRFETVTADLPALAEKIRPTLSADELREAYKARPTEFLAPPGELPTALFAGAPDLTPHDAFPEVREQVVATLATERARAEIDAKFDTLKNDVLRAFADKYYEAADAASESKAKTDLPRPGDLLRTAAAKAGLTYEASPLVPSTAPDGLGPIREARLGTTPSFDAPRFADLAFSPRTKLYDPIELTDRADRRYLTWKVEDVPARTPTLDEVRPQVVRAWKLAKARPLAEAEAKAIAEKAEKAGGGDQIRTAAGTRPVLITEPRAKLTPSMTAGGMSFGTPRATEIPELPQAGDRLREALFALAPRGAAVAPDAPEDVYYALTLRDKDKTDMASLYEFGRGRFLLEEVDQEAFQGRVKDWMATLRARAGLPSDWAPPAGLRRGEEDLADSR